jgi:hypothetical protein
MDECVDLGVVNLDGKTAITGPTSRPATTHSHCCAWPGALCVDGHTIRRLSHYAEVFSENCCSAIVPHAVFAARFTATPMFVDMKYNGPLPRFVSVNSISGRSISSHRLTGF